MRSLDIQLDDATLRRLQTAADKLGITPEQLLGVSVEEKLARLDADFRGALERVVTKNAELYKRLA